MSKNDRRRPRVPLDAIQPGARVRSDSGFIGTVEQWRPQASSASKTRASQRADVLVARSDDGAWNFHLPANLVSNVDATPAGQFVHVALDQQQLGQYAFERVGRDSPLVAMPGPHSALPGNHDATSVKPGVSEMTLPLAREELVVEKRPFVRGVIHVHVGVEAGEERRTVPTYYEEAIIERIPAEQFDGSRPPQPDEMIVPLMEERLVVQKQLVVREYLRIRKATSSRPREVRGPVRRETAHITEERHMPAPDDDAPLIHR